MVSCRSNREGCKPIFDREEIKKTTIKANEIEERRTVVAIDKEQSASKIKSRTSRKRSLSLSPIKDRIYTSRYPPSYQSRHHIELKHQDDKTGNCDIHKNDGRSSLEKRREHKEKYIEKDVNKHDTSQWRSREPYNSYSRLDRPTSGTPLFRGPQYTQIDTMELRRIKVDNHRNIPVNISVKEFVTEIQRDILNPEDVIVKRREGEGCKPIFDREEIKKTTIKANEIEERRTVVAIDTEQSVAAPRGEILFIDVRHPGTHS